MHSGQFVDAVVKEINGHIDNKSWELVNIEDIPKDAEIIPSVWAKRKKRNLGKPDLNFEDIQVSVDHDFGQYERDEQFKKNISLLTPKQREVILMRLDGVKIPEICQMLNCTPQNVHLLIQNGLKNIRKRS